MAYVIVQQGSVGTEFVLQGSIGGFKSGRRMQLVEENLTADIRRVNIDLQACQLLSTDLVISICKLQKSLEQKVVHVLLTRLHGVNKEINDKLSLKDVIPFESYESKALNGTASLQYL